MLLFYLQPLFELLPYWSYLCLFPIWKGHSRKTLFLFSETNVPAICSNANEHLISAYLT